MALPYTRKSKFVEELGTAPLSILDDIVEWIDLNLDPEEVYTGSRLEQWAFENGFRKFE
jgi:hypothetical protein